MKCAEAQALFSPYLDGAITGTQMRALGQHLETCTHCAREYSLLQKSQQLLTSIGRRKAPPDLALRLRVAISQEAAVANRPPLQGFLVRLENAINAFLVPVAAGMVSALLIFGVLMGFFALPAQLQASNTDVPLMLYTAPELEQTAFGGMTLNSIRGDSLVIEAYIDSNGRVQDYRIVSDPNDSKDLLPQVKNMLIFTTFRPATSMGRPTAGRAVLSFSKISVKG
jgi:hypothetical protein